ncbi:MAG: hypothetical protein ABW002_02340 [Xanthomonas sp.]
MALRASPQYDREHARFAAAYAPYDAEIAKAVDLFARIRNTDQAEDLMRVFQAARRLQATPPRQLCDAQQLLAHVSDAHTTDAPEEQQHATAAAIDTLLALDWIRLR